MGKATASRDGGRDASTRSVTAANARSEAVAVVFGRLRFGRRSTRLAQAEEGADAVGGNGAAEQPALCFRAAELFEGVADLLGLDAFGGDRHVKRVPEAGDGADDRRRLLAFDDGRDEALVDL